MIVSVPVAGNGYFTTQVLRELLHELDDTLTDEELDGIIEEVDADGSGTIDFDGKFYFIVARLA
jgi:Ca2+-binding EF-hand superfamily protein